MNVDSDSEAHLSDPQAPLNERSIHRLLRDVQRQDTGEGPPCARTGKLTMLAMCFVCLTVGATLRDMAAWAFNALESAPYGSRHLVTGSRYRCGIGTVSSPDPPTHRSPAPSAATDAAAALPQPGR